MIGMPMSSPQLGGIAVFVFRGFIPGFGVAYFPLQILGSEMRLIEGFSSGSGRSRPGGDANSGAS